MFLLTGLFCFDFIILSKFFLSACFSYLLLKVLSCKKMHKLKKCRSFHIVVHALMYLQLTCSLSTTSITYSRLKNYFFRNSINRLQAKTKIYRFWCRKKVVIVDRLSWLVTQKQSKWSPDEDLFSSMESKSVSRDHIVRQTRLSNGNRWNLLHPQFKYPYNCLFNACLPE